jgi:hypothetical protein
MKSFNEWLTSKNEFFHYSQDNKNLSSTNSGESEVIKLVSSPDLTIRKFPKTNNPAMADVLRNYARNTKVSLIDPDMGSEYLKRGDIYFVKTRDNVYFYHPATDTLVDQGDRYVSPEVKDMVVSLINKYN